LADKKIPKTTQIIAGAHSLVGVMSDAELALRLDLSAASIAGYRRRRGIAAAPRSSGLTRSELAEITASPITAFHDVVGTLPDARVAEKAAVSSKAVRAYRQEYSIESYRTKRKEPPAAERPSDTPEPKPAPKPAARRRTAEPEPPVASSTPDKTAPTGQASHLPKRVWRVLGPGERRYVIASTMVEAAAKLEAAGFRVGLKHVGLLLE
jgi:hypothetical protein